MSSQIARLAKSLKLPIVDATMDQAIDLEDRDVNRGLPGVPDRCAFALACNRVFQVVGVYFFKSTAYIQTPKCFFRFMISGKEAERIREYDEKFQSGKKPTMKVGTYVLRAPRGAHTIGAYTARSKARKGRHEPAKVPTGIRRKPAFTNLRQTQVPKSVKTRKQLVAYLKSQAKRLDLSRSTIVVK